MASFPINFAIGVVSRSHSVRDAIASYEEFGYVDPVEDLDDPTEADDERESLTNLSGMTLDRHPLDMKLSSRSQDKSLTLSNIIATFIYAVVGSAGYLMFGNLVSKDLLRTPGYNPYMNQATLWMLVISPPSKFALCTRPLNITVEVMLGLETTPPFSFPEDNAKAPLEIVGSKRTIHPTLKRLFIIVERITFMLLSVGVSILISEFSSVMAFLGSLSAFILCVIGPVYGRVLLQTDGKHGMYFCGSLLL
ncbi:hypothetical protein PILCRDRAFT_5729 [Piloderma croceum F 1598]|uniref:Amino acid transporter transmembrane domain-containing protein n=1 Tax=Piloderma croceum (strain F 1598) TaxID=765440 RepID=A0A0C3C6V7_PILCF|nr:hypothetical protein PILCRDRAFT_5729 [Piloderma croceum F 1598]